MLLKFLLFILSTTFVDGHHCVILRTDCTMYVVQQDCIGFAFTDDNVLKNDCRNAHMQQLAWLGHQYLIIAADPSESTLKMNIVPLEVTGHENPKTITVETVDFSHVIGYQCRFDPSMFVMAVFERFLYFTVICHNGAKIGLVKGVISQTGHWFIPFGSLSYSDINPRLYNGIFGHRTENSEDVLIYGYKRKGGEIDLWSWPLHYLNATPKTSNVAAWDVTAFYTPATMQHDIWTFKKLRNDDCFIQFSKKSGKKPDLRSSLFEIPYPCGQYAIHRADDITEGTSSNYIEWKYEDVTAGGGSSGCSQLSKLMKGAVDCDVNHEHIVMYVIIAIEGVVIIGIAVAFVVVMIRKLWKSRGTKLAASTARTEPKTDAKTATKTPVTDKPATEKAKLS